MNTIYHLWPKGKLNLYNIISTTSYTSNYLEKNIKKRFNNRGYPILISSGRVGITLILINLKIKKNEKVKIFPYASQCVKDAVLKVGIPSFSKSKLKSSINIIYHQYGYINFNSYKGLIIEDSVDSLVKKNGKLFLAGGNYEIWSLNKILGSFGGAILWCKNKRDYEKIIKIRDNRNSYTNLSWFIKLISTKFNFLAPLWYKIEILGGPVPKWALKQLFLDLKNWDEITKQRLKRFEIFKDLIPKWAKVEKTRIPCVIPSKLTKKNINYLKKLGMHFGERHFLVNNNKLIKVFLISIHQDIPIIILKKIRKILLT